MTDEDDSSSRDVSKLNRRSVLSTVGATAATFAFSGVTSAAPRDEEVTVADATGREVSKVARTDSFAAVRKEMAQSGGRKALDFGRAKTLRNANEPGFALAVPLQDDDEFDAQSTTTGLRARYRDGVADVLFDAGDSEGPDAANVTAKTDGVSVLSNCRFDPPGWNCQGVYDTEQICTIIGGVNAFILGNDATGIGFIDDILIPITGTAGAACGAEQFAELLIADWVGACSTDNWVYEFYASAWWNPAGPVVAPKCG